MVFNLSEVFSRTEREDEETIRERIADCSGSRRLESILEGKSGFVSGSTSGKRGGSGGGGFL